MECSARVLAQCCICKNRRPCIRPLRTINKQVSKCSISSICKHPRMIHNDAARLPPFLLSTNSTQNQTKQPSRVSETKVSALETWKHHARSWQILFEGKIWGKHQTGNSSWLAFDAASDCEDIFVRSLRQLLPGLAAGEQSLYRASSNCSQWMSEGRNGVKTESNRSQYSIEKNQLLLELWNTLMPLNLHHLNISKII